MYPFFTHDPTNNILYDAPNIEELSKKDAEYIPYLLKGLPNIKGFFFNDIHLDVSTKCMKICT